ncbi:three-helix bundle dimerization domain-containing protein [Naasia lichenicola]|uniref:Uncharacterized protein n=1 Tax=Naasia lichenicola TaxID=2565933 RepID=A0A4S4FI22_9MICO|nr:hypothetical protein [Naasia lichenicola]THG29983.1 hypothetical protein E6C64_15180 [Naasia lichenicola]
MTTEFDAADTIRQVSEKLITKYPNLSSTGITAMVRDAVLALQQAPIQDYISVLAEREVKRKLKLK